MGLHEKFSLSPKVIETMGKVRTRGLGGWREIFASRIMQEFFPSEENFLLLNENFLLLNENFLMVSTTIIEPRDLL